MKIKYYLVAIILSTIFFALGFYLNRSAKSTPAVIENTSTTQPKINDDNSIATPPNNSKATYSKLLKGKFILEGANYAGYEFIDSKTINWTNELFPMDPDTMTLKWIDESTFITKFTKRVNKDCPPGVSILKVVSYNGDKLVLKDYWTGWNDKKDEVSVFYKSSE